MGRGSEPSRVTLCERRGKEEFGRLLRVANSNIVHDSIDAIDSSDRSLSNLQIEKARETALKYKLTIRKQA